jgi:hypothetical protein
MELRVGLRGFVAGEPVGVSAMLLDSARNVAWRSQVVLSDSGAARVSIHAIPAALVGRTLLLTATAERGASRVFAGSDSAGATTLGAAATRVVTVYPGRSTPVGGAVRALVADAESRTAFVALVGSGTIGTIGLADGRLGVAARDGGEIRDLDVQGGVLAYLADAGSRLSFVPVVPADAPVRSAVLGPLSARVIWSSAADAGSARADTVLETVRPYATALRLTCDTVPGCLHPVAVASSPTEAGGSVLRLVRADSLVETIVAAGFVRLVGGADTVPSVLSVTSYDRPGGATVSVLERDRVLGCASVHLGKAGFDAAGGVLFSAGGDACGPGARVLRLDDFRGARPSPSLLGIQTIAAEDRILAPVEVKVAADASHVLVREADAVWLLDRDLRVLGVRAVSAQARIAWLGGAGVPLEFMIADTGSLATYDVGRFAETRSMEVGPLSGGPVAFVELPDGSRVGIFIPGDRFDSVVVVPIPSR